MTDRNECNCGDRHEQPTLASSGTREMPSLLLGNGTRRDFLRRMAAGSLGLFAASGLDLAVAWGDDKPRTAAKAAGGAAKKAKHLVVLWMQGGPSQVDTWDPKPGHKNGGPYKAIGTSVDGIRIGEHLPRVAKIADELAIIRSMTSREGNHARARYLLHTGYAPGGAVLHPSLGSIVSNEIGEEDSAMPGFVSVGGAAWGQGFLGVRHAPLIVRNPERPVDDIAAPAGISKERYERRLDLLKKLSGKFGESRGDAEVVADRQVVTERAVKLMHSPLTKAFDLSTESDARKQLYGGSRFGQGCLMAARLIEAGVPTVEVSLGSWDTHRDNFTRVQQLCEQLDAGMSALITDLRDRGLLEDTLVLWTGEFGRTPRINANEGRDHFPAAWSAVLAGGGIRGGQVIGKTSQDAMGVEERPVKVPDLMATVFDRLGIDHEKEYMSPNGRPLALADKGRPIAEVIA